MWETENNTYLKKAFDCERFLFPPTFSKLNTAFFPYLIFLQNHVKSAEPMININV